MSFDVAIFSYHKGVTEDEVRKAYQDPSIEWKISDEFSSFKRRLLAKYPSLKDLSDSEIDTSPWAYDPDGNGGYMIMGFVSGQIATEALDYVITECNALALIMLDPQGDEVLRRNKPLS